MVTDNPDLAIIRSYVAKMDDDAERNSYLLLGLMIKLGVDTSDFDIMIEFKNYLCSIIDIICDETEGEFLSDENSELVDDLEVILSSELLNRV
jgi:hypothetical protein